MFEGILFRSVGMNGWHSQTQKQMYVEFVFWGKKPSYEYRIIQMLGSSNSENSFIVL